MDFQIYNSIKNTEVVINKIIIDKSVERYKLEHPIVIHPLTYFLEDAGLKYISSNRNGYWRFLVIDDKKYMLARIKYGI